MNVKEVFLCATDYRMEESVTLQSDHTQETVVCTVPAVGPRKLNLHLNLTVVHIATLKRLLYSFLFTCVRTRLCRLLTISSGSDIGHSCCVKISGVIRILTSTYPLKIYSEWLQMLSTLTKNTLLRTLDMRWELFGSRASHPSSLPTQAIFSSECKYLATSHVSN